MKQYERPFIQAVVCEKSDIVTLSIETINSKDTLFDGADYFNAITSEW